MFASYLAGRLAQLGVVLLLVSVAVFSIMHALPGDPVQLMLSGAESGSVTPERQEQLREEMGLNDPLYVQYGRFLRGAVTADLGTSVRLRAPVLDLILDRLGSTLALSLGGILFAVIIGVTTGVLAALKQGSWIDGFSRVLAYAGVSLPLFWLGLLLIMVFSFWLPWFPARGIGRTSLPGAPKPVPRTPVRGRDRAPDAGLAPQGAGRGLRAGGMGKGPAQAHRLSAARAQERLPPGADHARAPVWGHARGRGS